MFAGKSSHEAPFEFVPRVVENPGSRSCVACSTPPLDPNLLNHRAVAGYLTCLDSRSSSRLTSTADDADSYRPASRPTLSHMGGPRTFANHLRLTDASGRTKAQSPCGRINPFALPNNVSISVFQTR